VLAEDPLDEDPKLRPDVVADRPVDRDVRADGGGQLTGDRQQLGLTEDRHRAVVRFEGVVEGELVIGEAQFDTARVGRAQVGLQGDQLLDDLGCLDRPVLVAAQLPGGSLSRAWSRSERCAPHSPITGPAGVAASSIVTQVPGGYCGSRSG